MSGPRTALATTLPFLVALAAFDAAAAAAVGDAVRPGAALLAFGYLVFVYVGFGSVPIAALAALARSGLSRWRARAEERFPEELGAAAIAFAALCGVAYWAAGRVPGFHNVELAAALAAAVIAAALLALGAVLPALADGLRAASRRSSRALAPALGGAAIAAVAVAVAVDNRSGLAQLPTGSVAVPLAALAVLAAAQTLLRGALASRLGPRVGIALAVLLAAGAGAVARAELGVAAAVELVAERAPVGRLAAAMIRAATDFDGDEAAPILGGGDCRPFAAAVNPGATEIRGDGVDNNCLGGDGAATRAAERPVRHALPKGFEPPNVVLITVEALRADRVGFLGYGKPTTPNLDALAARGAVFERMYSAANYTRLSLPALFSSLHPSTIDWRARKRGGVPWIGAGTPWLPEMLARRGFATAAFHVAFAAFTDRERIGFERGFATYDATTPVDYRGGTMHGFPSDALVDRIAAWVAAHARERFFVWSQFMEPHYLYERHPESPDFGDDASGLYDAEVWAADRAIGRLLAALAAAGVADRTAVLVVGDHGEALSEHGHTFHGHLLYDEEVRTAAVLAVPGIAPRRIAATVASYDLAPTLANLCGLELGPLRGRSLVGALLGEPLPERDVFLEKWSIKTREWYTAALVRWPHKLMALDRTGRRLKLFDLARDPGERNDLVAAAEPPDALGDLQRSLVAFIESGSLDYR
jgi:arylsulfatase A-like enzyme